MALIKMTLERAIARRNDMLIEAGNMARLANNRRMPWGHRYRGAVVGDECYELAKYYDALIKKLLAEGKTK